MVVFFKYIKLQDTYPQKAQYAMYDICRLYLAKNISQLWLSPQCVEYVFKILKYVFTFIDKEIPSSVTAY